MNAEFTRLINNIVRSGTVYAVDTQRARVRVTDGEWTSGWLQCGTDRAGDDVSWRPLSVGEQVIVLSPNGDTAQGLVIRSLYSDLSAPPSNDPNAIAYALRDGAYFEYNKQSHVFTINLGKFVIQADIELTGNITHTGNYTLNGDLTQDGTHTSTGDQVAAGISQVGHKHMEQGDGKPTGPAL